MFQDKLYTLYHILPGMHKNIVKLSSSNRISTCDVYRMGCHIESFETIKIIS